jgi:hypothetical protein
VDEEPAFSVDVMARAPSSSPTFLLREPIALLALATLGFSWVLDMAGGGCGDD